MATLFEQAFAFVIGIEGALDLTQNDKGNWTGGEVGKGEFKGTKYGISAASYPDRDIANLTLADAQAIYLADYWDRWGCDRLPPAYGVLLFDGIVNQGEVVIRDLQRAVGAAVDSLVTTDSIGPETVAHATMAGLGGLIDFASRRIVRYAQSPFWQVDAHGWTARVFKVYAWALALHD